MKKVYLALGALSFFLASCSSNNNGISSNISKTVTAGEHISEDGAIDCSELKDQMGESTEMETKVKGEVIGSCPDKTCVLKVDMGDGTCMNVKLNNAEIPYTKDLDGKTVILEGKAYIDTSGIKVLPGYESDSGRSMALTEEAKDPEVSLAFAAKGLIIK